MEYKYEQIFGDQSLFDGAPEEKAQRERDEWAKKASQFIDDELDCVNIVGEHVMRRFYNAMLSGELPMPKKGGE